jgi:pimeloyl-ACP methyl ester carboxylesterase
MASERHGGRTKLTAARRSLLPARCSGFRTPAGQAAYRQTYDRVLDELWPVPFEHVYIGTRFGTSHAVMSGPKDAPPVLLLHGAGLSAASWYSTVGALAPHRRVIAVDLVFDRGLGEQSAIVGGEQDVALWVAELLAGLDLDTVSLVGLSQGAWVAASVARFRPELVDRLALLAPAATLQAFRVPFWLLFRGLQNVLPKGDSERRARRTFELVDCVPDARLIRLTALGLEHFREQRPPVLPRRFGDEDLRRISCPTLLLVAGNEVLYSATRALQRARRLLPQPEVSDLVPSAGHFLTMARPDLVNEALVSFLGPKDPPVDAPKVEPQGPNALMPRSRMVPRGHRTGPRDSGAPP